MSVLVVAAHPDDEVLGCGGAIASLARRGDVVDIVILGEGATSRYDDPAAADSREVAALARTAQEVGAELGATSVTLLGLPDNRFDTVPLLDIVKLVEREVSVRRPSTVFVQHGGDLNIDHVTTFRAVLTATRPLGDNSVLEVLAFEVASSTEWSFQRFAPAFHGSVFYDITETIEQKIDALSRYEDEVRPFPHPRSPEGVRAMARRWGSVVGVEAAEAFDLVRSIR